MIDVVKMVRAFLIIKVAGVVKRKIDLRRDEDRGR
jgi:hypothetical protein